MACIYKMDGEMVWVRMAAYICEYTPAVVVLIWIKVSSDFNICYFRQSLWLIKG